MFRWLKLDFIHVAQICHQTPPDVMFVSKNWKAGNLLITHGNGMFVL